MYTIFSFNNAETQMSTEYSLADVVGELSNIEHAIKSPNTNSWGQSVGDELHQMEYQLGRIADALEIIAKKLSQ